MAVDVGTAVGHLDLDISGFLEALRTARQEAGDQTDKIEKTTAEKLSGTGKKLASAGKSLTKKVTAPIVGAGVAIMKVSSDFEAGMSKVSAISGATGKEYDALRAKAQEMGAKTKFSATEAASAFEYMAMAGWKTDDMLSGIEGIMNLAAASGEDLATTSDIVTDALTAFGLSAKDSGHFADILAAASSNANTNVSMLGESFKYVAPVAGAFGYSAEDTSIALGLMANAGIKSSQAGTALRTIMTNLAKPTDAMAAVMDDLGISLQDGEGNMKSLREVMNDLRSSFGDLKMPQDEAIKGFAELEESFANGEMTEKQYEKAVESMAEKAFGAEGALKAKNAAVLAGKWGMSGLLAIVNASEEDYNKLTEAIDGCSEAYNGQGAAAGMAETMMDNLQGQLTLLKSQLEGVAIQLGDIMMPYVKKFVDGISKLVDSFANLSPKQQEQVVKFAAIAAAIGPCLMIVGKLMSAIGTLIPVFQTIGTVIGGISAPVLAIVAVIGILVGAFTTLWKTNQKFKDTIIVLWNDMKTSISQFVQGIVDRINALGFNFGSITDVLKQAWMSFCNLLAPLFEGVFKQISNILNFVLDTLLGILDVFIGLFTGNWSQLWNGLASILSAVWEFIKATLENYLNIALGVFDVVLQQFGTSWETVWTGIKTFFKSLWQSIKSTLSKSLQSIKSTATSVWTAIVSKIVSIVVSLKAKMASVFYAVRSLMSNVWNTIKSVISSTMENARNKVQTIVDRIKALFTNGFTAAKNTISSIFESIKNSIKSKLDSAREIVSSGIEKMKSLFNFSWSLPNLKIPKISVKGKFSLNPPSVPEFGLTWFRKAMNNAMILNGATIFGMSGNKFLGGGEAGSEVIVGMSALLKTIKQAMQEVMSYMLVRLLQSISQIFYDVSDNGKYLMEKMVQLVETSGKYTQSMKIDKDDERPTGHDGDSFDYDRMAEKLHEKMKQAPIQNNIVVKVEEGDVVMDKEKVGRKVAPTVSRLIVTGQV